MLQGNSECHFSYVILTQVLVHQALKLRADCKCHQLSDKDPREHGKYLHSFVREQKNLKRLAEKQERESSQ